MRTRALGAGAAAVAIALVPSTAEAEQGGQVWYDTVANRLFFTGTSDDNHLVISRAGDRIKVADASPGQTPVPGPHCAADPTDTSAVLCGPITTAQQLVVSLDLAGGHDDVELELTVDGQIFGGDGDDIVHRYDDGDAFPSSVTFFGGTGEDAFEFFEHRGAGVRISLDGSANDGLPGDSDNVRQDVEVIEGTAGDDVLTADSSNDTIRGRGGNDRINGWTGRDTISCGTGRDVVTVDAATPDAVAPDCESVTRL